MSPILTNIDFEATAPSRTLSQPATRAPSAFAIGLLLIAVAAARGSGDSRCGLPADLDGSGVVGAGDLALLLGAWGPCRGKEPCAADLDRSGIVDAADLSILLGAWGATQIAEPDIAYGPEALPVYGALGNYGVADVDGDGDPDIVAIVSIPTTRLVTFLNDPACDGGATSAWTPIESIVTPNSTNSPSMFLFDQNGDGIPDAVTSTPNLNYVLGAGDGTFGAATGFSNGGLGTPVARIDVTGDGIDELVTAAGSTIGVATLSNGVLTGTIIAGTGGAVGVVRVADVDLDGDEDILFRSTAVNGSEIWLLRNDRGSFASVLVGSVTAGGVADLLVGDVTGDGWPDIVVPMLNASLVRLAIGDGTGGFLPPGRLQYGPGGRASLGDVDGDGDLDILGFPGESRTGTLRLALNNGRGEFEFETARSFPLTSSISREPRLLDLDGDCRADGIVASNSVLVLRSRGGTLRAATPVDLPASVVHVRDIDADGFDDLMTSGSSATRIFWGNGDVPTSNSAWSPQPIGSTDRVAFDCTGDGLPDLLGLGSGATLTLRRQIGPRTFVAIASTPTIQGAIGVLPVRADADQFMDVLVFGGMTFGVHPGAPVGPLAAPSVVSVPLTLCAAAGDLDGDGDDDIVLGHDDGTITVWRNEGGRFVQSGDPIGSGLPCRTLVLFDADGDGDADLFAQRCVLSQPGSIAMLYRNELGVLSLADEQECFECMSAVEVRDIDFDGLPDVVGIVEANAIIVRRVVLPDATFGCVHSYAGKAGTTLGIGDFGPDAALDIVCSSFSGSIILLSSPSGE